MDSYVVGFIDGGSFPSLSNIVGHLKLGSHQYNSIVVINKFQNPLF